ncbi:VOC family protein [Kribbella sp. NPDC004875]|uniref:VOC family protein n=1 Tax=Kribbella sp. NPDC004875 TaxID=3364107 RepID=UPI003677C594
MTNVWYDAPSHAAGASLVARLSSPLPEIDVRQGGVRVQAAGADLAEISVAARELGLTENPAAVQTLSVVLEAADPAAAQSFWQVALGYPATLQDPLRRTPSFAVRRLDAPRPLRNRIHVDVVRPADVVHQAYVATGREPSGAFGVMVADDEGNEIDLVPGDPLSGTRDWQALFAAMVFYPTSTPAPFVMKVAELADAAGIALRIDVRPEGVTVDSAKDRWEGGEDGADPKFVALAQAVEGAARELGLRADPAPLRFVQFGLDAMDVPAVRRFWSTFLGYAEDTRPHVTDIFDPRWMNPVLFFQQLAEPRAQRNRLRFELVVPAEAVRSRVEAALSAGGTVVRENPYLVADPEGNEVEITAARP